MSSSRKDLYLPQTKATCTTKHHTKLMRARRQKAALRPYYIIHAHIHENPAEISSKNIQSILFSVNRSFLSLNNQNKAFLSFMSQYFLFVVYPQFYTGKLQTIYHLVLILHWLPLYPFSSTVVCHYTTPYYLFPKRRKNQRILK